MSEYRRQVILDTETTGFDPTTGDRLVEIGCIEMVDRQLRADAKKYHVYINPQRDVPEDAVKIHGLTTEFLQDKPTFAQVADEFIDFVRGSELVIHNAPFDVGFLDYELKMHKPGFKGLASICGILDTLVLAKQMHPGQRNTLDALANRYDVIKDSGDRFKSRAITSSQTATSAEDGHGALIDSELLGEVYLRMTRLQWGLDMGGSGDSEQAGGASIRRLPANRRMTRVIRPNDDEQAAHKLKLERLSVDTTW